MIRKLRIILWHVVAELEYILYPWKDEDRPSAQTISKYNLPEESFDEKLNYDWLKSHDEKINKLEQNIIELFDRINKLNK
jgi:hypothetical protein